MVMRVLLAASQNKQPVTGVFIEISNCCSSNAILKHVFKKLRERVDPITLFLSSQMKSNKAILMVVQQKENFLYPLRFSYWGL